MSSSTASRPCCAPDKAYCAVSLDMGPFGPKTPLSYRVPEQLRGTLAVGMRVRVPLGARRALGVIVGFSDDPGCEEDKIKQVLSAADESSLLGWDLLEVSREIAAACASSTASVLLSALPPVAKPRAAKDSILEAFPGDEKRPVCLTSEQSAAIDAISRSIHDRTPETFLLFGVAGSGKTEVYLTAAQAALSRGRGVLVLVPEIALTFQMLKRFESSFGDRVAVLHSGLSPSRRAFEWRRVIEGSAQVVIGPRSAVFAPVPSIGLIVLDEEHDAGYKQDETPRYHARDVALVRAKRHGATVVLGSATPGVESYRRALSGEYSLAVLSRRVSGTGLPKVILADMRQERGGIVLGRELSERMREHLDRGEQVVLLQNRRGHSTFLLCEECGHVVKCPSCDVTLTLHRGPARLECHHCGFRGPVPRRCPGCLGHKLSGRGTGTQKVEEAVRALFPEKSVARLDLDAAGSAGAAGGILGAFAEGQTTVLVGTQMVAKGHDVKGVGLVGVISADASLHLPDYRSAERTFQLLCQVSGRAGRGQVPGEAVIQTYNPGHYSIRYAATYDFEAFYRHETEIRKELGYPPFGRLAKVVFSAAEEEAAKLGAEAFAAALRREKRLPSEFSLIGPGPAVFAKLRGRYRWSVGIKVSPAVEASDLAAACQGACEAALKERGRSSGLRAAIDIDPLDML